MEKNGFSLVELSIVLVILGLLVGGVLSGSSLIRAAELRTVITESTKFKTSTATFRDKYFAVPGDMTKATQFWGAAGGNASDNYTVSCAGAASNRTTCNGNGDGIINAYFGTPDFTYEEFRYWQHLGNAGLVEGSFNGLGESLTPGVNVPGSKLSSAGWRIFYGPPSYSGSTMDYAGDYGVSFLISELTVGGPVLTPAEAWNLDTKLDDGQPATGFVIARRWPYCTTSTSETSKTGNYALTNSALQCGLYFRKIY